MSGIDELRDIASGLDAASKLILSAVPSEESLGRRLLVHAASSIGTCCPRLVEAANAIEREAYAYWWRRLELGWRNAGKFDSADAARQTADSIESGEVQRPPRAKIKLERFDA